MKESIAGWWFKSRKGFENKLFGKLRMAVLILVSVQVLLGIITVLNATKPGALVVWGVLHQFVAMLLLIAIVTLLHIVNKKPAM